MINDIQETKQKNRRAVPLQTIIVVMVAIGFVVTGDPEQAKLYYDDSNAQYAIKEAIEQVRKYSEDERILSQLDNAMQLRERLRHPCFPRCPQISTNGKKPWPVMLMQPYLPVWASHRISAR